jgi:hypothetical protein
LLAMLLNALYGFIYQAQRIVMQQVFYLYIINQVMKQVVLQGKLYLLEYVIFIQRKKFSLHRKKGFSNIKP